MKYYLVMSIIPEGRPIGDCHPVAFVVEAHHKDHAKCLAYNYAAHHIDGDACGCTCVEAGPGCPTGGVIHLP